MNNNSMGLWIWLLFNVVEEWCVIGFWYFLNAALTNNSGKRKQNELLYNHLVPHLTSNALYRTSLS